MKLKFLFILFMLPILAVSQVVRTRTVTLMGSRFDITISARDSLSAEKYIDDSIAEITRIENVISEWKPDTEVSLVNRNAGIKPVKVSAELLQLTQRAIIFSELSGGAFDISFAAADRIWKFDGSMKSLPSEEAVKESVRKIGYRNIIIDTVRSTIFLKLTGMKIGFGSIGKGYAADATKRLLRSKGVPAGIINASGDLNTWGRQPDGSPWTVGITNPLDRNRTFATFALEDNAVVTSGNYEKFAMIKGRRYSHIIDPRTGYPVRGLASVTVIGPDAETANGFSTAIMVLGKDAGLKLIDAYPFLKCIIVTDTGEVFGSKNVRLTPN